MIYKAVNCNGTIRGYIIDNIFIDVALLGLYTKLDKIGGVSILGSLSGNNFKADSGRIYKCVSKFLTPDSYQVLFKVLRDNSIPMLDYYFVKVTPKDIVNGVSSYWSDSKNYKTHWIRLIVTKEGNKVGYISARTSFYTNKSKLTISFIETISKRKGYGSAVVRFITEYKSIDGLSLESSVPFWKYLGAEFANDRHFALKGIQYE